MYEMLSEDHGTQGEIPSPLHRQTGLIHSPIWGDGEGPGVSFV